MSKTLVNKPRKFGMKEFTGGGTLGVEGEPVAFETRIPRDDIYWRVKYKLWDGPGTWQQRFLPLVITVTVNPVHHSSTFNNQICSLLLFSDMHERLFFAVEKQWHSLVFENGPPRFVRLFMTLNMPQIIYPQIVKPLWPFMIASGVTFYLISQAQYSGVRCE